MATGKIGVTTENIFPVIKKFLYSDNEIFLRELVSNAVDATRKLRTLAAFGDFKGDTEHLDVRVTVDKEVGTLTVSDRGIGMDAEDIDKYINQIAFSGAEEFLAKYKDNASVIIGHFGLGFYSAFMVSSKVVIRSLSYKEGAKAVQWTCDGSPEYDMEPCDKAERGTDVILYIDDESKEYLEQSRIDTLLRKYCRFLPVPVISGKVKEWKDGKYVDTDKDNIVNSTEPLWTRKPADLTDEDYLKFYHELMPGQEDPMFWIHLNVDYPFTLTGILYFPKVKSNIDIQKNRILLYSNQVFVTDQVEGVVPEFMTIMQGVIDSPDIPLNVSRSYLQADRQVKRISTYISKKVAERLEKLFRDDRKEFEKKWDDIRIFIEYGMLTDEKFDESARKFFLFKDVNGDYFTMEDYNKLVAPSQTDKEGNVVYLYTDNKTAQYSYVKGAEEKGYSVLMMDGDLDQHLMSMIESKEQGKIRFVRVDSDIPERLIPKDDSKRADLEPMQAELLTELFSSQMPKVEGASFIVDLQSVGAQADPATVTQNEFMRRMKEMAAHQGGMNMFGAMPDNYSIVVNTEQPVVKRVLENAVNAVGEKVTEIRARVETLEKEIAEARKTADAKPADDATDEARAELAKNAETAKAGIAEKEKQVGELRKEQSDKIAEYARTQPVVKQIVDLALLQNGLLKGEALSAFISRSVSLL